MAASSKILDLLRSLRNATAQGRLQWSESTMRETFELALRDAKILINEEFDQGSDIYYFNLSGPTGKTVDSELFNEGDEGFDLIRDLFTAVRRNALHVDDLIDRVISEVENDRN